MKILDLAIDFLITGLTMATLIAIMHGAHLIFSR